MKKREIYSLFEQVNDADVLDTENYEYFDVDLNDGRIFLCTLSGVNYGEIKKPEDFEKPMELAVRALDALLTYQDYPLLEAELSTLEFRNLGIGINNLAYFFAKHGVKYDESALVLLDEYMESMSYYAIKASVQLAKEFGPCEEFHKTKWAKGEFPWERRAKAIDDLVPFVLRKDWESLRKDLITYGIRNANLLANMPSESNSQLVGATNGIEPPVALISKKKSKDGILKLTVPDVVKLAKRYDLRWDQKGATGYLKVVGVISKWIDQASSVNTSYNPEKFNGIIPFEVALSDILMHYQLGGTTLYYNNINDGATDHFEDEKKPEPVSATTTDEQNNQDIEEAEECPSCTL